MVTLMKYGASCNELVLFLEGLSTDTKPIEFFDVYDNNGTFITKKVIENGSKYTEIDTGKEFAYDAENETWYEDSSGGGGGVAVYNATITIQKNGTKVDDFTANQRTDKTINITVPTQASDINAATATQGGKADTAVQTIKVNSASTGVTKTGDIVDITAIPASIVSAGALVNGMTATTQTTSDDSAKVATTAFVHDVVDLLPSPMVFKGSLGTGGTITTLPTASSSNKGYVYKVITAGTYASQSAKVGDTFISDGSAWVLIPSGDEPSGTVTNVAVANGGGLTVSGSPITTSGTITVGHSNSVTAKTSSSLKKFTYDANGHVTGSSELSTAESDALASGIDSTKVAQIETNKNNILSLMKPKKGVITWESAYTPISENVAIRQYGNIVVGQIYAIFADNLPTTETTIATISGVDKTRMHYRGIGYTAPQLYNLPSDNVNVFISGNNGQITVIAGTNTSKTLRFNFVYCTFDPS